MSSTLTPNRWILDLTDEDILHFSFPSDQTALREHNRKLRNLGEAIIRNRDAYDDMLGKFKQQIHIAEEAEQEADAQ